MSPEPDPMATGQGGTDTNSNTGRHGTQTLIAALSMWPPGTVLSTVGDSRTEDDFAAFLDGLLELGRAGNALAHPSATTLGHPPVRKRCAPRRPVIAASTIDLGEKGKSGILKSHGLPGGLSARQKPRRSPSISPRNTHHGSTKSEICVFKSSCERLVAPRQLPIPRQPYQGEHRNFHHLLQRDQMAKPFKWTMTGKPLTA